MLMHGFLADIVISGAVKAYTDCLQWPPGLLALHALSDGLMALAFFAIPATLAYLMWRRRRRRMAHARIYAAFGLFILAAGAAHAAALWVLWFPHYEVEGLIKLVAALAAVAGAGLVIRAMPRLLVMPSNPELQAEIDHRTAELVEANRTLVAEVLAREAAQVELRASEERFRGFAGIASDWLWETDAAMNFTYISDRTSGGGAPPPQFVAERRAEDVVDADRPVWQAHLADVAARRPFRNLVYGRRGRDGRVIYSRVSGMPMFDADGRFRGYRGASSDATAEVEAEQRAQAAHALLLDAVESLPAALLLFDREERLVLSNSRAREMLPDGAEILVPGRSAEEMFRAVVERLGFPGSEDDKESFIGERMTEFRRGSSDGEEMLPDGRWLQVFRRRTSDGGLVSIRLDITPRKQAEDQLRQAQKMQAIGQLTGGIAHDFNNLLTVIVGNLDLIVEATAADTALAAKAASALQAAERGAELTKRLLAFARRQSLQPRLVEVNGLTEGMGELLRRSLGSNIELALKLDPGLWPTLVDPGEVENALLNLAINARDAMPEGGRLTIETANRRLDADYAAQEPETAPGDYVMLAVSDNGAGMTPDVLARAFEPFFSTKPPGQGTGLGLSTVYGFAKQSGGHVKLYSEPGHGTTVRLYLPRAEAGSGSLPAMAAAVTGGGRERILVVEDDADVRTLAVSVLRGLGYDVLEAGDGPAALVLLRGGAAVDLLFTDLVMPGGLNGAELAEAARALRPRLKTLYTSGYTEAAAVRNGQVGRDGELLSKPYRRQELAESVRQALDRREVQA